MKNTKVLYETHNILIFRNLEDDLILTFKDNRITTRCDLCQGRSKQYYTVPKRDGLFTYCNICFTRNKKYLDWNTIDYHAVFNNIIKYVRNNLELFTETDLELINYFFSQKTNKHFKIEQFINI